MTWTAERIELLKKLRSDGLSANEIAVEIGGVTRSAVLGKSKRLGLSTPRQVGRPNIAKPKPVKPKPDPTIELPPAPVYEMGKHLCSLFDLTNKTCRYPCWDEGTPFERQFYCGIPSANLNEGHPYCAEHSRIVRSVSHYAR